MAETSNNKGLVTKLMRRLECRNRMMDMLERAGPQRPPTDIERLRMYLVQWADWERGSFEKLGAGVSDPLAHQPSSANTASDYLERADRWAMGVIEAAIDDLLKNQDGALLRAALRLRYLHEGLERAAGQPIRVYRHNRLAGFSLEDIDRMADRAEADLVPLVRKRSLPL